MGKKKVIKQTESEVLKEKDKLEEAMAKAGGKSAVSKKRKAALSILTPLIIIL